MDILTTRDLVNEIRSQVDESNTAAKTDADVLAAASRGLREMVDTLSVHYPSMVLSPTPYSFALVSGQQNYAMPPDSYEGKVLLVSIDIPGNPVEVYRRDFRDEVRLRMGNGLTATPWSWDVRGQYIHFQQRPSGAYAAKAEYVRTPEKLVIPQGRITSLAADGASVVLGATGDDAIGPDLSTELDSLGSFVNIVSWRTGAVKCTLQVSGLASNRLTFRSVPSRSSVQGRTISSAAPVTGDSAVELDDFVCLAKGTCVPQFQGAMYNFLVDFGVAALARSLGGDYLSQLNEAVLEHARELVDTQWAGQAPSERVSNRASQWSPGTRRLPPPTQS